MFFFLSQNLNLFSELIICHGKVETRRALLLPCFDEGFLLADPFAIE